MEHLKYPIGKYKTPEHLDLEQIPFWVGIIRNFPAKLIHLVENLSEEELNWKYRPDGWCIRQVVHHCADSHLNAIVRFKLALTEDVPTIKPYLEGEWAKLNEYQDNNLSSSIQILKGVHHKLSAMIEDLTEDQLKKEYYHPEHKKNLDLYFTVGMYAWHANHHLAHVEQALAAKGSYN